MVRARKPFSEVRALHFVIGIISRVLNIRPEFFIFYLQSPAIIIIKNKVEIIGNFCVHL